MVKTQGINGKQVDQHISTENTIIKKPNIFKIPVFLLTMA